MALESIAVVTCARPDALRRCLASYARHALDHGRRPRFLVASDTPNAAARSHERSMLAALSVELGVEIHYSGAEEKQRFGDRLARLLGGHREDVDFALARPPGVVRTAGANRNAVLLGTVGQPVWMVDDDTVCRPAALPNSQPGVAMRRAYDPTEVILCADRMEATSSVALSHQDLFAAHEQVLGQSAGELVRTQAPCTIEGKPPPPMLLAGRAMVSWVGFYGDSGARNPAYCVYRDESTRRALVESEARHRALVSTRKIVRGVRQLTLIRGGYCQTTSVALDNRSGLVPFFPFGRAQDLLFGSMLSLAWQSAWFAFLPHAVLHAPWERRRGDHASREPAQPPPGLCVLMMILLDELRASSKGAVGLGATAAHLCSVHGATAHEFRLLATRLLCEEVSRRITVLDSLCARHDAQPSYWALRLREHMASWERAHDAIRTSASLRLESMPAALRDDETTTWIQRSIASFGRLLELWPELTRAAAYLAKSGMGIGAPTATIRSASRAALVNRTRAARSAP